MESELILKSRMICTERRTVTIVGLKSSSSRGVRFCYRQNGSEFMALDLMRSLAHVVANTGISSKLEQDLNTLNALASNCLGQKPSASSQAAEMSGSLHTCLVQRRLSALALRIDVYSRVGHEEAHDHVLVPPTRVVERVASILVADCGRRLRCQQLLDALELSRVRS